MDPSWLFEEIRRRWGGVSNHHAGYPESYPKELERTATLDDGTPVSIRPIRPDDIGEMRAAFARLSPESIYRRFHTHIDQLSDEACRYLTHVDYVHHLALVALSPDGEQGIAVARYYRPEGNDLAEAAVVVVDDWQGRGLGPLILEHLVEAARARGIVGFEAYVQTDNKNLLKMLANSGYKLSLDDDGDALRVEMLFGQQD